MNAFGRCTALSLALLSCPGLIQPLIQPLAAGEVEVVFSNGFESITTRITAVDYDVIAHGGRLQITGVELDLVIEVIIGGVVLDDFTIDDPETIIINHIADEVPVGNQGLVVTTAEVKANNSATIVISGAPAPSGGLPNTAAGGFNDDAFLSSMASAGARNFMDCVGIHYNAGTVPPSASSGAPVGSSGHYSWYYPSMVNLYRGRFPGVPLCLTEIGYVTADGFPQGLPGNFSWAAGNSVQEQAQWLAEAAVIARNSGAVRLFIVWNVDSNVYLDDDPQAGYAIVRPDGTCPACNTIGSALGG